MGATCVASVAERSAGPRPAGILSTSAPRRLLIWFLCGARSSSGPDRRPILPRLYGFPGATNFASVPTSISPLRSPAPRDSPHPWARARTLTHTRRRACARPRAPSRGVSSAPEQIPLSRALLLTQASSRHGASSVCGSGGGASGGCSLARSDCSAPWTESGRSGIGRRSRGEEEPRRARRSLASNPRTAAPGKRLRGPQHPWGVGTRRLGGVPGPAPEAAGEQGTEGSGRGGRGAELEVRLEGGGVGEPPAPFPDAPRAPALLRAGGARRPTQMFSVLFIAGPPVSARAPRLPRTNRLPCTLDSASRLSPSRDRTRDPALPAQPSGCSLLSTLSSSCLA